MVEAAGAVRALGADPTNPQAMQEAEVKPPAKKNSEKEAVAKKKAEDEAEKHHVEGVQAYHNHTILVTVHALACMHARTRTRVT